MDMFTEDLRFYNVYRARIAQTASGNCNCGLLSQKDVTQGSNSVAVLLQCGLSCFGERGFVTWANGASLDDRFPEQAG
eukprot:6885974-Prorocentrum_lima.AAC.1